MRVISKSAGASALLAMLIVPVSGSLSAQSQESSDPSIVVNGKRGPAGPEIKGVIVARHGDKIKVNTPDGNSQVIAINEATQIKSSGGLFSGSDKLASAQLVNGLPVTVKTIQADASGGDLLADRINLRKGDFKTAMIVHNGTSQRFEEQAAATESLRGRMADIDKYNVKSTTNVHFDTGKASISEEDKASLCSTATAAQGQENALMLVVGYTDSTGGDDLNQELSEKRAARVINYLQQNCGWKPYRMLTPTGMAKADPAADNSTAEGKAQNRRVAVNILVSKSVDGM